MVFNGGGSNIYGDVLRHTFPCRDRERILKLEVRKCVVTCHI